MLPKLIFKYFFYNKKRTFVAVFVLGCTLSLIIGTNMLLDGYRQQISNITESSLTYASTTDIILKPNQMDIFSEEDLNHITSRLNEIPEVAEFYQFEGIPVLIGNMTIAELRITDISKIVANEWIVTENNATSIIMSESFLNADLPIDLIIAAENRSIQLHSNNTSLFEKLIDLPTDFYVDRSSTTGNELFTGINLIEIEITENSDPQSLLRTLSRWDFVTVEYVRGDIQFIDLSVDQIINILKLLQVVLSVLLILSISYIMISIVNDSAYDIRQMNTIGFSRISLFSLFLFQSVLISIFSFIFGIVISLVGLNMLFSIFSASTTFPYLVPSIDGEYQLVVLIETILLGVIAGIVPAYKAVSP